MPFQRTLSGLYLPDPKVHNIQPRRAEQFVVVFNTGERTIKLFSVQFDRPLEVYVHLPYFDPPDALLGRYRLSGPRGKPETVALLDGGMGARSKVKFTHHRDGRARFTAQDHIWSVVENRSFPLASHKGHLFTVVANGWSAFKPATKKDLDPGTMKRQKLEMVLRDPSAAGAKIVGWWHPLATMEPPRAESGQVDHSHSMLATPSGLERHAIYIAPPEGWYDPELMLALSVEPFPAGGTAAQPFLLFQGGFQHEHDDDLADLDDLTMLVAHYRDRSAGSESLEEIAMLNKDAWLPRDSGVLVSRDVESVGDDTSAARPGKGVP